MKATRTRSRCTAGSVLPRPTLCAAHPHAHDRRAGEAIFWAELRHWTTGGISPPQLCLTVRAECLRGPMSDRLRARAAPNTCTSPPPAAASPSRPLSPAARSCLSSAPRAAASVRRVCCVVRSSSRGAFAAGAWAVATTGACGTRAPPAGCYIAGLAGGGTGLRNAACCAPRAPCCLMS